ncbi:MAG TPA: Trm112 family protein [Edaphobacter sp.]|nr:Trm112 family protein [Edaphobacter sp.]
MNTRAITAQDLHWLVCPVCRQTLQLDGSAIRCNGCGRCYPIVDGIPVLLEDRAQ